MNAEIFHSDNYEDLAKQIKGFLANMVTEVISVNYSDRPDEISCLIIWR